MSELNASQIMILGFVATIVAAGINLYLQKRGQKPGRRWITVGLYVIAVILAYFWAKPLLPVFPVFPAPVDDPGAFASLVIVWLGNMVVFLGELIAAASSVVGFATMIYNVLLKQVVDKVGAALGWITDPQQINAE